MAKEREEVEKLLQSKARIEKRISRLEGELDHLRHLVSVVDKFLAAKSFKVAGAARPAPPSASTPTPSRPAQAVERVPPPSTARKKTAPLKSSDGTFLGTVFIGDNEVRVVPSENIKFNVNTPPFNQFLITKVLGGMVAKDREEAMAGAITPDETLTYQVVEDGDILKEVVVRNCGDDKRTATLRNSIRWTLEKMYEKMRL